MKNLEHKYQQLEQPLQKAVRGHEILFFASIYGNQLETDQPLRHDNQCIAIPQKL